MGKRNQSMGADTHLGMQIPPTLPHNYEARISYIMNHLCTHLYNAVKVHSSNVCIKT